MSNARQSLDRVCRPRGKPPKKSGKIETLVKRNGVSWKIRTDDLFARGLPDKAVLAKCLIR